MADKPPLRPRGEWTHISDRELNRSLADYRRQLERINERAPSLLDDEELQLQSQLNSQIMSIEFELQHSRPEWRAFVKSRGYDVDVLCPPEI